MKFVAYIDWNSSFKFRILQGWYLSKLAHFFLSFLTFLEEAFTP